MKRIKQIEESKKMISDALIRLLQDYPLDEISISQITDEAQISRNTFYNHFHKKEDVLDYMMHDFLEYFQERFKEKNNPSIRDFLILRFSLLKENPLLIAFHKQYDMKQMFHRFRESKTSLFNFPGQIEPYRKDFFQGGIDYMTSRWILNGMKESPEQMADKALSFMKR